MFTPESVGLCTYILHLHVNASQIAADQPVSGGSDKSKKADIEPPPFLYSISAWSLSPGLSLTTVCRSIQGTIRKERCGREERKKGKKKKKNEGSELSPPLRLLFNTATERGRERSEVKQEKK